MPTKLPRISVSLSTESKAALDRLSEASGIASSMFISQILDNAIPMVEAMTRAFLEAKKSPLRAAEIMQEAMTDAHVELAQHSLALDSAITKKKRKMRKRPTRD